MAAGLSVDLDRWRQEFDELMLRLGGRFARVEPRRRVASFIRGLLAGLPRVNCWTIAEHAGDAGPRGMQRLLSAAVWDEAGVRDDLRGSTRPNRPPMRSISSSNSCRQRSRSTLRPAATARSSVVHTPSDHRTVAAPRPRSSPARSRSVAGGLSANRSPAVQQQVQQPHRPNTAVIVPHWPADLLVRPT